MKMAKLYALTWIIFAAAALSAYTTDSLSPLKLTLFSFLGSMLLFMGICVLLPYLMRQHYESKQLKQVIKEKYNYHRQRR